MAVLSRARAIAFGALTVAVLDAPGSRQYRVVDARWQYASITYWLMRERDDRLWSAADAERERRVAARRRT